MEFFTSSLDYRPPENCFFLKGKYWSDFIIGSWTTKIRESATLPGGKYSKEINCLTPPCTAVWVLSNKATPTPLLFTILLSRTAETRATGSILLKTPEPLFQIYFKPNNLNVGICAPCC